MRIGIIGDLHTHWDDLDVALFDASHYDLLVFIGDLGGGSADSSLRIARIMSRLTKPALVMPGNNDTGDIASLAAELTHRGGLRRLGAIRNESSWPAAVRLCGYSSHRLVQDGIDVTLIAARPHSMGGPDLSFADYMASSYDIPTMQASARRLRALVDAAPSRDLVFVGHNGPTGLGGAAEDMWGCDFRPGGGDWGDPDLAGAVGHAQASGRRVLAVIAGHMHLRTKGGIERAWRKERDGVLYVNAARVPRIIHARDQVRRHHVAVELAPGADGRSAISVREVLLDPESPW